jgi:glutamate:GABA antiporter
MSTLTAPKNTGFKKALKIFDMTLFTVCAIMVVDTLAASASIGWSSITWWIITLVLFFIPYGLITAELGSTYPEEGGIYIWIKHAFGQKWAARSTWYYWINVALWMPSVYILFAGMFSQMFFPDMSLWMQIAIGIVMTWITVWIGCITLETGKWVPNIGAAIKVILMLVLGIGGIILATKNGVANEVSFHAMLPTWDAGLAFLPVILYNFMGFELMSGAGDEMQNPKRDIPIAIIVAGVLIAFFYLLSTTGILMALPIDQLGLISGIIDTLKAILGDTGIGGVFVTILGVGALYTFLANMVTWTMGANRTAAQAADEGELPAIFGKLDPVNKTPVGAYLITGVVSTIVIILYGFMAGSAEDLFWTLFKFSSIIFFLPYLLLFPAFMVLRKKDASINRPYKMPGGELFAKIAGIVCEIFIIQAIVFFLWVPGQEASPDTITVLIGMFLTILVGEVILISSGKRKKETREA